MNEGKKDNVKNPTAIHNTGLCHVDTIYYLYKAYHSVTTCWSPARRRSGASSGIPCSCRLSINIFDAHSLRLFIAINSPEILIHTEWANSTDYFVRPIWQCSTLIVPRSTCFPFKCILMLWIVTCGGKRLPTLRTSRMRSLLMGEREKMRSSTTSDPEYSSKAPPYYINKKRKVYL